MSTKEPLSVDDIHTIVNGSNRNNPPASAGVFAATIVFGIPICLTVLPVSILYSLGKAAIGTLIKSKSKVPPIDSGIQVDSELTEWKDRKYDVVLYGATGFTGKLAVMYLAKNYGVGKDVKWAIAGRSQSKLDALKQDVAKESGIDEILQLDIIIADSSKPETIPGLVRETKAVMTTAGPFAKYGSSVVECCAKFGTHYVDITGEGDWVKETLLKWDATAQASGAKLISCCGLDCIPWDLTVMKLESALPEGETLKEVTCLDNIRGGLSGGTIATVLMGASGEAPPATKHSFDPALKLPDGTKSPCNIVPKLPSFVSRCNEPGPYNGRYLGFTFFALTNSMIIRRSAALRMISNRFSYKEYAVFPDFKSAFIDWFSLVMFVTMLTNPITGPLLKSVLPKPGEGPSMEDMENNFHLCVTGYGVGSKGSRTETVLYFPRDAGYLDTARMLTESALCLVFDKDKLPNKNGGFFTTSTGMGDVLLDRLVKTGCYFASKLVTSVPAEATSQ